MRDSNRRLLLCICLAHTLAFLCRSEQTTNSSVAADVLDNNSTVTSAATSDGASHAAVSTSLTDAPNEQNHQSTSQPATSQPTSTTTTSQPTTSQQPTSLPCPLMCRCEPVRSVWNFDVIFQHDDDYDVSLLQSVDCSDTGLTSLPSPLTPPPQQLQRLKLTSNTIDIDADDFVIGLEAMTDLTELYLDHNQIYSLKRFDDVTLPY